MMRKLGNFTNHDCAPEPDTLVVRYILEEREWLLEQAPDIYGTRIIHQVIRTKLLDLNPFRYRRAGFCMDQLRPLKNW
jgi:hypothetical protein